MTHENDHPLSPPHIHTMSYLGVSCPGKEWHGGPAAVPEDAECRVLGAGYGKGSGEERPAFLWAESLPATIPWAS